MCDVLNSWHIPFGICQQKRCLILLRQTIPQIMIITSITDNKIQTNFAVLLLSVSPKINNIFEWQINSTKKWYIADNNSFAINDRFITWFFLHLTIIKFKNIDCCEFEPGTFGASKDTTFNHSYSSAFILWLKISYSIGF